MNLIKFLLGEDGTNNVNELIDQVNRLLNKLIGIADNFVNFIEKPDGSTEVEVDGWDITNFIVESLLSCFWNILDMVVSVKNDVKDLSSEFDEVMDDIDEKLGEWDGISVLEDTLNSLINSPFIDQKTKNILKKVLPVVEYYAEGGEDIINTTFKSAFRDWAVFWIPFIPIPGWWTVQHADYNDDAYKKAKDEAYDNAYNTSIADGDIWGTANVKGWQAAGRVDKSKFATNAKICPLSDYAYAMGVPSILTFDMTVLMVAVKKPDLTPKPIPPDATDPTSMFIPEKLKPYSEEWLSVYRWLDENKIYALNDKGSNTTLNISQEVIGDIVNTYIDDVYDLYSGILSVYKDNNILQDEITNIIVNEDKSEITNITSNVIENPTKEETDIQHFININNRRKEFNHTYKIKLSEYIGA